MRGAAQGSSVIRSTSMLVPVGIRSVRQRDPDLRPGGPRRAGGFIFLILPGIFPVMLAVAIPALVVENRGHRRHGTVLEPREGSLLARAGLIFVAGMIAGIIGGIIGAIGMDQRTGSSVDLPSDRADRRGPFSALVIRPAVPGPSGPKRIAHRRWPARRAEPLRVARPSARRLCGGAPRGASVALRAGPAPILAEGCRARLRPANLCP